MKVKTFTDFGEKGKEHCLRTHRSIATAKRAFNRLVMYDRFNQSSRPWRTWQVTDSGRVINSIFTYNPNPRARG
jgi:hypothetical protein